MKLDSRIKALSDILTCFDIEKAGQFLGQKGYFTSALANFQYLDIRKYGILTDVRNNDYPFREGYDEYCAYFIPESRLESVEKIDEMSILKYKIEKLEKNLIELKRELNNQKTIYNPFALWTNCCASISYSDGFNPQSNCCSNK